MFLRAAVLTAVAANCAAYAQVKERLEQGYGETVASSGLSSYNSVVEVWASEETGTWTITETYPNGQSCIRASGQHYDGPTGKLTPTGIAL